MLHGAIKSLLSALTVKSESENENELKISTVSTGCKSWKLDQELSLEHIKEPSLQTSKARISVPGISCLEKKIFKPQSKATRIFQLLLAKTLRVGGAVMSQSAQEKASTPRSRIHTRAQKPNRYFFKTAP